MADSNVFTRTCEELALRSGLDLVAVRGVVRIALREAGLKAGGVSIAQMLVVLRRVLPGELRSCGVTDPEGVCLALEPVVMAIDGEPGEDPIAEAAAVFERFGPR